MGSFQNKKRDLGIGSFELVPYRQGSDLSIIARVFSAKKKRIIGLSWVLPLLL